ncbi:hypothetical protein [Polynucleobacter sp. MWH-Braz-FAM2G]|uniref:hypothetical protein n=1 Tax=Polynucleobacter sp. MWH-Braz-FAM2G TaxID=1855883 RepID=UPI001BFDE3FE|nr:hypothetical protein [Polynucleobacter sp. MWH-Braz-FAM2G]QWD89954.1 hypothetical protein FD973_06495 [Polynucleobacter sp. MWH-Braz-FAM2G]
MLETIIKPRVILFKKIIPVILVLIMVTIVGGWLTGSYSGLKFGSWQIAEWLINYQSGFIRRGLIGQLLYSYGDGQNLLYLLYWFTFLCYALYCTIFLAIYFLAKIESPKVLLIALLIPGGILPMGMTMQFFNRKEILFLILFGILCLHYLWLQRASPKWRTFWICSMYAFAICGGISMMLIHEGYLFMGYPLTVLLMWLVYRENSQKFLIAAMSFIYIVVIPILFIYCAQHKGDASSAQIIWDSLSLSDRVALSKAAPYTAFGPIASLGWGMTQHLLTIYGVYEAGGWIYWLLFFVGNSLILIYLGLNLEVVIKNRYGIVAPVWYLRILMLGFVISLAMFVIAADWGRWIAFVSNASILLAFTLTASPSARKPLSVNISANKSVLSKVAFALTSSYVLVAILLYAFTLKLPECCVSSNLIWFPYGLIFSN